MPLDDRLRQGLPGLASSVDPDPDAALPRVREIGRRRRMIRWVAAGATVAALVGAAGVAAPRVIDALMNRSAGFAGRDERRVESFTGAEVIRIDYRNDRVNDIQVTAAGTRCSDWFGFHPTYLPPGFEDEPVLGQGAPTGGPLYGPAPGAPPAEKGQAVVHWTDGERSIEIRRPGMLFVELAQEEGAPTITVLEEETSSFGPVAPNYENPEASDFMVQFRYPSDAQPVDDHSKDCAFYSLNEYGLGLQELVRVAEGLRPA